MRILLVEPGSGAARPVAEALTSAGHVVEVLPSYPAGGAAYDLVIECRSGDHWRTLEDELLQARKLDLVGRLAGGVAHDFNNLLTVINGYAAMLEERFPAGDPGRAEVEEIRAAGDRAASLTRQLLAFSRVAPLQPRILNLNDVLGEIGKMLRRLIGEQVTLETKLAPDLGTVCADPAAIEQIILNLALNARDSMPQGGRLGIATRNDGDSVVLAVSDTGEGILPHLLDKVFEPFHASTRPGLAGLGLSTVHGLVHQSGGRIEVENRPGRGVTFKVRLPRMTEDPSTVQIAAASPSSRVTVLLVEDEQVVRRLAAEVLKRDGHEVLEAGDPDAALAIFEQRESEIGIVISDVVMPQMSGRGLVDLLRARRPDLKVLFMSGYADEATQRAILAQGFPLLQKPFTARVLTERVRGILEAKA